MEEVSSLKMEHIFHSDYKYTDRKTRQRYVFEKYQPILKGKVLDVGADGLYLKTFLPSDVEYVGIGLGSHPDLLKIDLEKEKIPFQDDCFDCVLCLDVLEHLENIHDVFDELCRVTRKWAIISLPNPYNEVMNYFKHGKYKGGQKNTKFYGLPLERETDRHKWFFSAIEAEEFVKYRAAKNHMQIIEGKSAGVNTSAPDFLNRLCKTIKSRLKWCTRSAIFRRNFDFSEVYDGTKWWVLRKQ